jgi:dipeptide transport system ATP-binding protein
MMQQASPLQNDPLLDVDNLVVEYPVGNRIVHAVSGVSLQIARGETLGLVGESGCGKSTLARLVTLIEKPSAGTLMLDGADAVDPPASAVKTLRRTVQIVFQNPYGSLNPRKRVGDILEEPLIINTSLSKQERRAQALDMMAKVGLRPEQYGRYPHMFSGGQRQRIAIARALVLEPKFLILDEPTSALDVSVQAQIVDLLRDLQKRYKLAYLFISHDLKVVRALANAIIVLRHGKVVEQGPARTVFAKPKTDYTKALLAAAFELQARRGGAVAT